MEDSSLTHKLVIKPEATGKDARRARMESDSDSPDHSRLLAEAVLRRYLAGVEQLARKARLTVDPRVRQTALAVLAKQVATVKEMFG